MRSHIRGIIKAARAGTIRHGLLAAVLLSAVMVAGCSSGDDLPHIDDSESHDVLVRLVVPASGPTTRGLTTAHENEVKDVIVLGFDDAGMLAFQSEGEDIADTPAENIKTFNVTLPGGTYDMLFLANCKSAIEAQYTGGQIPLETTSYPAIRQALKLSVTEGTGWVADGSRAIPMVSKFTHPDNGTVRNTKPVIVHPKLSEIEGIDLERAIARVDIDATAVKDDFVLTGAYLYRYNKGGWVFPELYKTAAASPADINKKLYYTATTPETMVREIYLLEVHNSLATLKREDRVALVIGGKYGTDTYNTYYRVDFKTNKTDSNYIDITRNGLYTVKITSVSESGWPDPDVAFYGQYKDILVEITSWEEKDFPNTPL